jgi:hypothetical protein
VARLDLLSIEACVEFVAGDVDLGFLVEPSDTSDPSLDNPLFVFVILL